MGQKVIIRSVDEPLRVGLKTCEAYQEIVLNPGDSLIHCSVEHQTRWQRCQRCNGAGRLEGNYCTCIVGIDLKRVERDRIVLPEFGDDG